MSLYLTAPQIDSLSLPPLSVVDIISQAPSPLVPNLALSICLMQIHYQPPSQHPEPRSFGHARHGRMNSEWWTIEKEFVCLYPATSMELPQQVPLREASVCIHNQGSKTTRVCAKVSLVFVSAACTFVIIKRCESKSVFCNLFFCVRRHHQSVISFELFQQLYFNLYLPAFSKVHQTTTAIL